MKFKESCLPLLKLFWTVEIYFYFSKFELVFGGKLYVNYTGDIVLGGLFPIHRRGPGTDTCDKIQLEDGVQPLEALLYTLDKINQNESILPGIRIGLLAMDTCDSTHYALEQSLDFIKEVKNLTFLGSFKHDPVDQGLSLRQVLAESVDHAMLIFGGLQRSAVDNIDVGLSQTLHVQGIGFIAHYNEYHQAEFQCSDGSSAKFLNGRFDSIVGVIGGQSSSVSIQVANLLRLFQVPQISYMSTSPQLSNRERFPYFFRTVPSDVNQAHAILDILRHFNWTYVAVIYTDSEYGIHCYETLRDVAANDTICFTTPHRVIRDQYIASDYDQIIRTITNKVEIRVIILILEKEYTKELIQAAQRLGVGKNKKYIWIGTDAWSSRESVVLGQEDIVEGAIAIQPLVSDLKGFDEYFKKLNPKRSAINPWFSEFWEENFKCKLPETNKTKFNENFTQPCSPDLKIGLSNPYSQQSFLHFVRDSAYAFAYALHNMHLDLCDGKPGLCSAMQHIDGLQIVEYLKNVTFKDEEDAMFRFVNVGDGPTRYTIVNFQRIGPENATYQWKKVGNYSLTDNGNLELKIDENIRYRLLEENGAYPSSTCAHPCKSHEVKVRDKDDTCCWKCKPCGRYETVHDDFHCDECPKGFAPDKNHSQCLPIPEEYIDYRNPWAILAMGFASVGILTTVFVGMVFWTYNDTPIIKAAGRELSYVLLFGILLSFCVTFVIVAEPNQVTCGIMRFFLGFCPTLCYAAIVTKTNRIARIFHPKPGNCTSKTKYISPTSQMIIVGILTAVDILINIIWIYLKPPEPTHIYPDRGTNLRICKGLDSYSYMVGFIYPVILIGFCTIYAIQTRKCPGGFNETKYIAFTNYTIIIIWLAFVPLYIASTSNSIRVVTLAISLTLSGMVELGCLFFPKIYIVLFKPEKNTKEVVMAPNRSSFATLSAPNPTLIPQVTPQSQAHLNGKYKQQLYPEGILISSDNFSEVSE